MECQFCHKEFKRPCGLAVHERTCKENPNRTPLENHICNFKHSNHPAKCNGWTCGVCGLNFRVRSELTAHLNETNHKINLSHKRELRKCQFCGKEWNVTLCGFHNHENHCCFNPNKSSVCSHYQTEESRKRISESRKRYIEEHPDQAPFKLNHSSKKSYPEKHFEELFITTGTSSRDRTPLWAEASGQTAPTRSWRCPRP